MNTSACEETSELTTTIQLKLLYELAFVVLSFDGGTSVVTRDLTRKDHSLTCELRRSPSQLCPREGDKLERGTIYATLHNVTLHPK